MKLNKTDIIEALSVFFPAWKFGRFLVGSLLRYTGFAAPVPDLVQG